MVFVTTKPSGPGFGGWLVEPNASSACSAMGVARIVRPWLASSVYDAN